MKIVKVTLVCLIVLSNTLERTLKDQQHKPMTEKPSLRKLEGEQTTEGGGGGGATPAEGATPEEPTSPEGGGTTTTEECDAKGNYIIVKYSTDLNPLKKKKKVEVKVLKVKMDKRKKMEDVF